MEQVQPQMKGQGITLFQFQVPEIAQMDAEAQQRILDLCWKSAPVQDAWKLYWSRPMQWSLIPVVPIAIFWAVTQRRIGILLAIVVPIAVVCSVLIRRYYRKHLVAVLREQVVTEMREDTPRGPQSSAAVNAGGAAEQPGIGDVPAFSWRAYKRKLILMAIMWVLIVVLLIIRHFRVKN